MTDQEKISVVTSRVEEQREREQEYLRQIAEASRKVADIQWNVHGATWIARLRVKLGKMIFFLGILFAIYAIIGDNPARVWKLCWAYRKVVAGVLCGYFLLHLAY